MEKDYIIIATDLKSQFAIRIVSLEHGLKTSLNLHDVPHNLAPVYGEFMIASTLLGSRSDDQETYLYKLKLTEAKIQINCEVSPTGPFRSAIFPAENRNHFNGALKGELHVTRLKKNNDLYQSMIHTSALGVNTTFQHYLDQSLQRDSYIALHCNPDHPEQNLGLWVEKLPQTPDTEWQKINQHLKSADFSKVAAESQDPDKICQKLFPDGIKILAITTPRLECSCQKEKIISALRLLPDEELVELFMDGKGVETQCDYCQKLWKITDADIKELFVKNQTIN